VGRDPRDIVRTAHAGIVVTGGTEGEVDRRIRELAASPPPMLQGLDAGQLRRRLVSGTPDEVSERLRAFAGAGADGVTMSLRGVAELRPIELAAQAAAAAFAA